MRKRERQEPWQPCQVRGWKLGSTGRIFPSSSLKMFSETFLKITSYFQKRAFPWCSQKFLAPYVCFLPHRLDHFSWSWSLLHSVAWSGEDAPGRGKPTAVSSASRCLSVLYLSGPVGWDELGEGKEMRKLGSLPGRMVGW